MGKAVLPKQAGAVALCSQCPKPNVHVSSEVDIQEVKTGPYGDTSIKSAEIKVEGGCTQCKNRRDNVCCCLVTQLNVKLKFLIKINIKKLDKGVWFNVNNDPKKLGRTKTTAPNDSDKDKGDWKKVDKASVEKHERTHVEDIQAFIKEKLEEIINNKNIYTPLPCRGKDCDINDVECKERLDEIQENIKPRLKKKHRGEDQRN